MSTNGNGKAHKPAGECPNCGEPARDDWHPFCSKRCADVDLNRWLSGGYAIPTAERPDPSGDDGDQDA